MTDARTLNRDEVMKVLGLDSCENLQPRRWVGGACIRRIQWFWASGE